MMNANLFKIECLTNLHVGSGDINYNIIDNEVEKDISGYPVIHASGVKGAFKDAFCKRADADKIFGKIGEDGKGTSGEYKFFDARFLSRPLRVGGNSKIAFVPVTTVAAVNDLLRTSSAFGCNSFGIEELPDLNFGKNEFLVSNQDITNIEGSDKIKKIDSPICSSLEEILGDTFAIARDINDYPLPVIARNCLEADKRNLWYEEYVPHHSCFWLIVLTPDKFELELDSRIQFGGNASVGCGYTKISEFKTETEAKK